MDFFYIFYLQNNQFKLAKKILLQVDLIQPNRGHLWIKRLKNYQKSPVIYKNCSEICQYYAKEIATIHDLFQIDHYLL